MSHEYLQGLLYRTPLIVSVREYFYQAIKRQIENGESESKLPFAKKNMYECWVNYAPYFFAELQTAHSSLLQIGYRPEDLSQFAENKSRVLRYSTQILLPGAYLDQVISNPLD